MNICKKNRFNHVGRPRKEEIKKYNKKKQLKIIGIIISIIIIFGCVFLYLNRNRLELSGMMGSNISQTMLNVQNDKAHKTLTIRADAYDGKYLYQRYAESGNQKLVTYIYNKLGFGDVKKYKRKAILFYYNGLLLSDKKAYATGKYIRLHKSAYGKALSAYVYAQNLTTGEIERKPIRIYVAKTGPFVGTKYKYLTNRQLKELAYLCYAEQGTVRGAIFEAALMANRFELYPDWYYGRYEDSIYDYVKYSGWWNNSEYYMHYYEEVPAAVLDGVKKVLLKGYRPMPLYIDEHDCIDCGDWGFNVDKIVVNGKSLTSEKDLLNRKNYISKKTKIYNVDGSKYTFYIFPSTYEYSDPFGYTDEAVIEYKRIKNNK